MIRPEQVWVAVEPVNMRMGIDGLSLKIQQALGAVAVRRDGFCLSKSQRQTGETAFRVACLKGRRFDQLQYLQGFCASRMV